MAEQIMDESPTPQQRAELAEEQEYVHKEVSKKLGELNILMAHAYQAGMLIEIKEIAIDNIGQGLAQVFSINRTVAYVGFRRGPLKVKKD